jgi:dTDP-4-amino-4,6-dideoxygalactose transaminase
MLFHPHIPNTAVAAVADVLQTRWIGQGPKVDELERRFVRRFGGDEFLVRSTEAVAVNSCTSALHLAYILAGIGPGDEVVSPVFTCTATNIPLLYCGATIRFADVQAHTLNIDPQSVSRLMTERTKTVVCVHYGGLPCDMDELQAICKQWGVPLIGDAAQALGAIYHGEEIGHLSNYTCYSFQAIKHITTGDGGMLLVPLDRKAEADRRRWFGIDRKAKLEGTWANDITEVGYKYQMTDIAAAMAMAAMDSFEETLALRRRLLGEYTAGLRGLEGIEVIGANLTDREHAAWLLTVRTPHRRDLTRRLREAGVECDQVHYRNDRYSIFGGRRSDLPNMDAVEDEYLVLPLHTHMTEEDVQEICAIIRKG